MGEASEKKLQMLFSELSVYEKKGVYMQMNGAPASPMQIVNAHVMADGNIMRDYVLNDSGDIQELCFNDIKEYLYDMNEKK